MTEIEVVARYKEPGYSDKYGGIVADMRFRSADLENFEWLNYPRELLPEDGHYDNAQFTTTITVSEQRPDVTEYVRVKESLAEFEAKHKGIDREEAVFYLYHPDTGEFRGSIQILDQRLPNWLEAEGDRGYMVVRMELQPPSPSPERVEELRQNYQDIYDSFEEDAS